MKHLHECGYATFAITGYEKDKTPIAQLVVRLDDFPKVMAGKALVAAEELESLKEFARTAASMAFDGLDYNGGEIQEKMCELGLLVETKVFAPCSEDCACAGVIQDFSKGEYCYRLSPFIAAKGE